MYPAVLLMYFISAAVILLASLALTVQVFQNFPKFRLYDLVSFGPVCAVPRIFTRFTYVEDFNFGCMFSSMTDPLLISRYKSGPCKARVPPCTRAYCFLEHMVAAAF